MFLVHGLYISQVIIRSNVVGYSMDMPVINLLSFYFSDDKSMVLYKRYLSLDIPFRKENKKVRNVCLFYCVSLN